MQRLRIVIDHYCFFLLKYEVAKQCGFQVGMKAGKCKIVSMYCGQGLESREGGMKAGSRRGYLRRRCNP